MVYVTQEVEGRNIAAAWKFGEVVPLLPPGDVALSSGPTTRKLQGLLRHFSDGDYLLLMGDPVLIGIACAVACEANAGRFKVLKWDRQNHLYYPVAVDMNRRLVAQ
jgi:hypothetical protein